MPASLPLVAAAPLLCAGITTYSPMRHFGLDKAGMKLGVVGLGGLGHMAVKFGKVGFLPGVCNDCSRAAATVRPCVRCGACKCAKAFTGHNQVIG